MLSRSFLLRCISSGVLLLALPLCAEAVLAQTSQTLPEVTVDAPKPRQIAKPSRRRPPQIATSQRRRQLRSVSAPRLSAPVVIVDGAGSRVNGGVPPLKQRYQLPQTSESLTGDQAREQINAVDAADAIKYFPSLFVRKRNYGDNQAVLATRTTGLGASARSLVYADDILLSSLIANNNTLGVPQWNLVSPEEIKRIDFLYGPFSAAYPGSSEGGVLIYTTKMPDKFEMTTKQTEAFQTFGQYDTKGTFRTDQTSVTIGDRQDKFSYFIAANYQNSYSQPLAWVTTTGTPANTIGTIPQSGRTPGSVANVVGAGGLLHTEQATIKGKFAYDITPWVTATYTIGLWTNNQDSSVQSYLRNATNGLPTFGGVSGFASNNYTWDQTHLANAVSLKSDTKGVFDFDISLSRVDFLQDIQRMPFGVTPTGLGFTSIGRIARLDGTNWMNGDANGIWRPNNQHEVSFGFHADRYNLNNPTYQTPNWTGGPDETNALYSDGLGTTRTFALWGQDAWRFAPNWKLTTGVRLENWEAYNGFNLQTTTNAAGGITSTASLNQAGEGAQRASPKVSLAFEPNKDWLVTGSFGMASRFPTVSELYQVVTAGNVLSNPNPNLKPEDVLSEELAIERRFTDGKIRLSLFNENSHNTLISQANTILVGTTPTLSTFTTNVDKTRTTGVELAVQKDNVLIDHLEAFGSVTYADARIVSDPSFTSTTGTTANGKRIPNIPAWRVTSGLTYRPDDLWSYTVAMRYASKQYSTLDNTDTVANVFQAFDSYVVVDLRAQRKVTDNATVSFGIDNVGNEKYTLFHPFPQRTYIADVRVKF